MTVMVALSVDSAPASSQFDGHLATTSCTGVRGHFNRSPVLVDVEHGVSDAKKVDNADG